MQLLRVPERDLRSISDTAMLREQPDSFRIADKPEVISRTDDFCHRFRGCRRFVQDAKLNLGALFQNAL
jgi:hypothetical protein